jgi:type I restriction enzyme S subunit
MIDGLTPYPEMKATGAPWLPTIPKHWQLRRNGRLFGARKETGYPDLPILEVSIGSGVRLRDFESGGRKQQMTDRSKYQRAAQGDIAYNMMRMWQGAVGVVPVNGLVSPAYVVAYPYTEADARYFAYLFRTADYKHEVENYSRGIVPDRNRLYWESFKQILSPIPPVEEQRLIVRFLDAHGAFTARLIRAKQRLIRLLEEQKQAIIHRALTRGLDPNVRLKPSGVLWLGDIPEPWDVVHLRYLVRCLDGQRVPLNGTQRGAMQGPFPYWGANRIIDHVNSWLFDEDLVLLGEDGAPFFEAGRDVSFAVSGKIWVNNHAHVLKCKPCVSSSFLATALNCVDYRNFIDGSTRDKLTQRAMGSIPIQVPEVLEQRRIVDRVDQETSDLRHALRVLHGEISLIRELRSAVIADIVTGKLNVRAAASALPEVTEFEPIDEPTDGEDLEDLEGAFDDVENEAVAA